MKQPFSPKPPKPPKAQPVGQGHTRLWLELQTAREAIANGEALFPTHGIAALDAELLRALAHIGQARVMLCMSPAAIDEAQAMRVAREEDARRELERVTMMDDLHGSKLSAVIALLKAME